MLPAGLSLTLRVPATGRRGVPVPVAIVARNTGAAPLELSLLGREIVFDIEVRDSAGRVVWRRLEGRTTPMILRLETIQPGRELVLRDSWTPRAAGRYAIVGVLPTDGPPLRSDTTSIDVR